jgi:hypothetical protein
MKAVRSGARRNRDLSTGSAAELRSERRRLDSEFLQGLHRHQAVRAAGSAERGERAARGLPQRRVPRDAEVGAHPVHGEVVGVRALSVHAELSLVVEDRGGQDHPRRQRDQRLEAPPVEGQALDEGAVDHGADHRRLRIHERSARFHRHGLGHRAQRHLEVDLDGIQNVELHVGLDQLLEAGLLDLDAIGAGRKIRQVIFARCVGRRLVADVLAGADGGDPGLGDRRTGGIGDPTSEGSVRGLGAKDGRTRKQHHEEGRHSPHDADLVNGVKDQSYSPARRSVKG